MPDENENINDQSKEDKKEEQKGNDSITPPVTPIPESKPFPSPQVLEAVVDPKIKPKEGPVAFSFSNPEAIHEKQAEPTKGDAEKSQKDPTLEELDEQIRRDEKSDKNLGYEDYKDSAEMFVDMWEGGLIMLCRAISKDTSDATYGFLAATREKLIRQGIKVSRKRGWVMPIELMAAGTLVAATGTIIMKATDRRKEYMAKNKTISITPTYVKEEITKGGPNKGHVKRRGAGNPR